MPDPAFKNATPTQFPQKESAGPIVGAIIIVILLIIGGFFLWSARSNQHDSQNNLPLITGDVNVNP